MTGALAVLARRREAVALALIITASAIAALLVRRDGHWWGDDWALYVRQADSILGWWARDVIDDNHFTVEVSGLPEFSPPMYPWGYALLLAPFVAVLGTDLDRLVISQIVFLSWFVVMWYRLARPRAGAALSLAGALVIALSPQYLSWSEFIQSELAFMAVAATGLVLLDRARERGALVSAGTSLWPLVAVGVAGAGAFSIRREGLAVMAAIGVAQLAALVVIVMGAWRRGVRRPDPPAARRMLGRLAVPYLSALGFVALLQLLLPSTLVPRYEGNGIHNVWGFASDHLGNVMESIGLRRAAVDTPTVLGSAGLGTAAVTVFVLATIAGLVAAIRYRPAADLPVAAFMAMALVIGGSFRFAGTRYVAIIGPIALLFVISGVRLLAGPIVDRRRSGPNLDPTNDVPDRRTEGVGRIGRVSVPASAALCLVTLLAVGNAVKAVERVNDAREFARVVGVQWGPDHPASLEMYEAIRTETGPDDVIGFFKARSVTQRTDRRAVQVDQWHPLDRTIDHLDHFVIERARPDRDAVVRSTDPDRLLPIWSNTHFILYEIRN